ncbi:NAD(P)/FAD-dependent oxidoreductase [Geodermatophilus marinus]|uniref:NAD(P)/FAD-dependent oxidoreductase n=1 Tax=Geodermatophilus sp. LHW52908 TaxID=2303986 RepID=UPI000E3CCF71|nr:NAD(P)-binding protein [Geodermatophilus sp. LHW52908]RFU19419.1 NAD/FAD-dependent oxidoreductase [Geodermatophilus sp. LHW52908]
MPVVGGGIAGVACARALAAAGRPVRVLDRGRRPGGRMASRTLHDRVVDLGASYLTAEEGSPFAEVVAGWVGRGLARPWTDTFAVAGPDGVRGTRRGPLRYGAPGGLRSLVADLADGLEVEQGRTVEDVAPGPRLDGEPAPAVVLAMPDPQARRLLDPPTAAALLDDRPWLPALAVVLGWETRRWPADLHGAFVHDDPAVEWVADDGDRRGDGAPVLVAHSTPDLAAAHLEDPGAAAGPVAAAVTRALGIDGPPAWTAVHRWTFARPARPREEPFGLVDGIGACGDGWSAPSRVQSAWTSGTALGRALA